MESRASPAQRTPPAAATSSSSPESMSDGDGDGLPAQGEGVRYRRNGEYAVRSSAAVMTFYPNTSPADAAASAHASATKKRKRSEPATLSAAALVSESDSDDASESGSESESDTDVRMSSATPDRSRSSATPNLLVSSPITVAAASAASSSSFAPTMHRPAPIHPAPAPPVMMSDRPEVKVADAKEPAKEVKEAKEAPAIEPFTGSEYFHVPSKPVIMSHAELEAKAAWKAKWERDCEEKDSMAVSVNPARPMLSRRRRRHRAAAHPPPSAPAGFSIGMLRAATSSSLQDEKGKDGDDDDDDDDDEEDEDDEEQMVWSGGAGPRPLEAGDKPTTYASRWAQRLISAGMHLDKTTAADSTSAAAAAAARVEGTDGAETKYEDLLKQWHTLLSTYKAVEYLDSDRKPPKAYETRVATHDTLAALAKNVANGLRFEQLTMDLFAMCSTQQEDDRHVRMISGALASIKTNLVARGAFSTSSSVSTGESTQNSTMMSTCERNLQRLSLKKLLMQPENVFDIGQVHQHTEMLKSSTRIRISETGIMQLDAALIDAVGGSESSAASSSLAAAAAAGVEDGGGGGRGRRAPGPSRKRFLKHMLDLAATQKMLRIQEVLHKPRYVVYLGKKHFTRSYEPYDNDSDGFRKWIEDQANDESPLAEDQALFDLINDGDNVTWLEKRMTTMKTYRMPEGKRSRDWHAFRNGWVDVRTMKLYRYGSLAFDMLPKDIVACAFHDSVYDEAEYQWYVREGRHPLEFMAIPTVVDEIIECQKWSEFDGKPSEEPVWIYAEGAALLFAKGGAKHPLRKSVPTHIGPGGLGKTTLLLIFSLFYDPLDIAQFKTKDEEVFGFENLPKCYIWMGYDMGRDWKIDHTFLFTLIDGGWIKISRKFKKNIMYYVEQYGMLAMNDYLNLPDTGGAWSRRNLPHRWKVKPPKGGDRDMVARAEKNIGAVFFKCGMSLQYLSKRLGKHGIDDKTLPASMVHNLHGMQSAHAPMMSFFESPNIVLGDPDAYVDTGSFHKAYKWFCKTTGANAGGRLDETVHYNILSKYNCSIIRDKRPNPNSESLEICETNWVVGCTLKKFEAAVNTAYDLKMMTRSKAGAIAAEKRAEQRKISEAAQLQLGKEIEATTAALQRQRISSSLLTSILPTTTTAASAESARLPPLRTEQPQPLATAVSAAAALAAATTTTRPFGLLGPGVRPFAGSFGANFGGNFANHHRGMSSLYGHGRPNTTAMLASLTASLAAGKEAAAAAAAARKDPFGSSSSTMPVS